jgi:hypothetical protein
LTGTEAFSRCLWSGLDRCKGKRLERGVEGKFFSGMGEFEVARVLEEELSEELCDRAGGSEGELVSIIAGACKSTGGTRADLRSLFVRGFAGRARGT